jgi:hypothetical protein
MSNDFWRGWWWSKIVHEPPTAAAPGGAGAGLGCFFLMIGWPILLECFVLGAAAFQYVSVPPGIDGRLALPMIPSMGLPVFFGWWAGLVVAIIYLASHGFWPLGLALTVFWTPIWVLFGHQFDVRGFDGDRVIEAFFTQGWEATAPLLAGQEWKWGIFCGVLSLIGHLGLTASGAASARAHVGIKQRAGELAMLVAITFGVVLIFWLAFTLLSGIHDPFADRRM